MKKEIGKTERMDDGKEKVVDREMEEKRGGQRRNVVDREVAENREEE